jgi:uncharacterized protein YndB with AHSA1/START domain
MMLEIRHIIPAARQRVFDAWTHAKGLDRWSAPSPMTPKAELPGQSGRARAGLKTLRLD